jgi:hypothetical protein
MRSTLPRYPYRAGSDPPHACARRRSNGSRALTFEGHLESVGPPGPTLPFTSTAETDVSCQHWPRARSASSEAQRPSQCVVARGTGASHPSRVSSRTTLADYPLTRGVEALAVGRRSGRSRVRKPIALNRRSAPAIVVRVSTPRPAWRVLRLLWPQPSCPPLRPCRRRVRRSRRPCRVHSGSR